MSPPCRYDAISPIGVEFREPMPNHGAGLFIPVFYSGNGIVIQTPKMESPGVSVWRFNQESQPKYSLNIKSSPAFAEWCASMDAMIIGKACESWQTWFGKDLTAESIKTMYQPILKEDVNHDEPMLKLTIPFRGSECRAAFFDANNKYLDVEDMPRNYMSSAIIEIDGLWFQNRKFGLRMKLVQAKFHGPCQKSAFLPDDD